MAYFDNLIDAGIIVGGPWYWSFVLLTRVVMMRTIECIDHFREF